jgi:hypothetical protein
MAEYKFNNEEKELARRITELHSLINALDARLSHGHALNNSVIAGLQKEMDKRR